MMAKFGESDSYRYEEFEFDGLTNRDIQSRVGRKGYSRKPSQKMSGESRESGVSLFTRRTAQILDIASSEVEGVMTTPSKKGVRVNTLRLDSEIPMDEQVEEIEASLEEFEIEKLPWFDGAYLFDAADTGAMQEHELTQRGKLFIQNPSSLLPVIALDPARGSKILDVCSAPGGKAALIAALNRQSGAEADIYANELKARRLQRMREVFGILGVRDVATLNHNGNHLPSILGRSRFDRVLVDAECSTDSGVNFESSNPLKGWSLDRVQRMSVIQKQLVISAYDMLEPGGVLVYSTCTLSPEENEGVVATLLSRREDAIIQPLKFESEETARKIKKWNGERYPSEVSDGVVRIFPNSYMESFCLTRIRKSTGDPRVDASYEEAVILDDITDNQGEGRE